MLTYCVSIKNIISIFILFGIEKFKGKFLIRGGRSTSNEGEKSPRTVVIEFSSYDEANNFYKSTEYQLAHSILKGHADRQHQIIEGV